jgi:hypothetical protein
MTLYTVEVHYNESSSSSATGELVCTDDSLFGILYTFDKSERVREYKVSSGANTVYHKEHFRFQCDKLVQDFDWSNDD